MEIVGISKAQWSRFIPVVPYLKIYSEKKKILSIKQNDIFMEDMGFGLYSIVFSLSYLHIS